MSRENKIQAVVLKKQDYSESDQIVTLFSKERGKVRAFLKSSKLQSSKLQSFTQSGFEIKATLTISSQLPKLIQAEVINAPAQIYNQMELQKIWFVAAELLLRAVPDEQPHLSTYSELTSLLEFLKTFENSEDDGFGIYQLALLKFQMAVMQALGLGLQTLYSSSESKSISFNASLGGFIEAVNTEAVSGRKVPALYNQQLKWLSEITYPNLTKVASMKKVIQSEALSDLVNEFISYQLEREIKSHRFYRSLV